MNHNLIAQTVNFGDGLKPNPDNTIKGGLADFDVTQPLTSTEKLISNVVGFLTTLGTLVFIFMFVYGALNWISAGGDASKVQKARDQMIQGVIGLIIMIAGYAVIGLIGTVLGISILNPAQQIRTIFDISGN